MAPVSSACHALERGSGRLGTICPAEHWREAEGKWCPRTASPVTPAVGVKDVTVKLYPGARHEIFNETNRDEVTADLLGFLARVL